MPIWQGAQLPPLQTMSAPQGVPLGRSADSMQTGAAVLQAMVPVRHALPGTLQAMPCMQGAQVPLTAHTMSVPHGVPAGTLVFASLHVGVAPEQTSVPLWHLFVGVQGPPCWQVAQAPA